MRRRLTVGTTAVMGYLLSICLGAPWATPGPYLGSPFKSHISCSIWYIDLVQSLLKTENIFLIRKRGKYKGTPKCIRGPLKVILHSTDSSRMASARKGAIVQTGP